MEEVIYCLKEEVKRCEDKRDECLKYNQPHNAAYYNRRINSFNNVISFLIYGKNQGA